MAKPIRVHDGTLTIRANRQLIEDAKAAANKQGANLSELIRQLLRELAKER